MYEENLDFMMPLVITVLVFVKLQNLKKINKEISFSGGTLFTLYRPFFEKNKKLYIKMEILYKSYDYEEKNIWTRETFIVKPKQTW